MTYSQVKNPVWANAEQTLIDCQVDFDALDDDFVPFTASPKDLTSYGPEIFAACVNGEYGPIGAYVPPPPLPPPTADQNKSTAIRLLIETDWVNQPDVVDPNVNPHLLNQSAFITYRVALRSIAVNPQAGDLNWPQKPQEQWS